MDSPERCIHSSVVIVSLRGRIVFFITGEKQNHEKSWVFPGTQYSEEEKWNCEERQYFSRPLVCEENMPYAPPYPGKELTSLMVPLPTHCSHQPKLGSISLPPPMATFLYNMPHYCVLFLQDGSGRKSKKKFVQIRTLKTFLKRCSFSNFNFHGHAWNISWV